MRMLPRPRTIAVLCALASLPAWGQPPLGFHWGTWGASLKASYQLLDDRSQSPDGSADLQARYRSTREGLTIRNEGFYFYDPRLVTGTLGLTLESIQEHVTPDNTGGARRARLLGYSLDALFLENLPYNGQLFATRNQDVLNQPFGRTDTVFENRGVALHLREDSPLRTHGFPYFSADARIEQTHIQETTTSASTQQFRNDERQDRLTLEAHNGFETGDLNASYLLARVDNANLPEASFDTQNASLSYSRDFGPRLDRRSDTQLSVFSRSGASRSRVLLASEALRIEHAANLSSSYDYGLTHTDTTAGRTFTQNASGQVRYQPYANLTARARINGEQARLPEGTRTNYAGQGDLAYDHALPWGGRLSARAGGRRRIDENRLQAAQIAVVDEAQTAPALLGAGAGFLLNQPFAVAASIAIVDARGGGRLPVSPGIDYELVAEGDLTRVVPLPTSTVIRPGDPLLVDYVYRVDPSIRYATMASWVGSTVDYHWIAFSFDHQQSSQRLLSGQDTGFLQDLREDNARLDLRGDWRRVEATASAALLRHDSTRLVFRQREYTQSLSYRPTRALALGWNLGRTQVDYRLPARRTELNAARLSLEYFEGPWTVTGQLGRRIYKDTEQAEETVDEGRLSALWSMGKLSLTAAVTAGRRSRGGFRTTNYGLAVSVLRQF